MSEERATPDALADEILELRVKLAAMSAFAGFGKDVMEWILDNPAWWGDESSEEIMPIAEKYRLAECVAYDPEIHGYEIYADEGDEIWWIDSNKWPAANDEIVKLRADIERIGRERDDMSRANAELQARLSAMEDDHR